jgi:23S rRNA G2069 N7-methylase RlmK/C1962 C5-methylase RlmI
MLDQLSLENKKILDCTCGGRTIWFNKNHPNVIYADIREEPKGVDPHRPNFCVCPDILMDYRDMSFPDNTFHIVVWDPPHLKDVNENSWFFKKYGSLNSETWQKDIALGFSQCMRVLKPNGVLIMKWSCPKNGNKRTITNILKQESPLLK